VQVFFIRAPSELDGNAGIFITPGIVAGLSKPLRCLEALSARFYDTRSRPRPLIHGTHPLEQNADLMQAALSEKKLGRKLKILVPQAWRKRPGNS